MKSRKSASTSGSEKDSQVSDSRRRQTRRDDAIRRKIESDLNKKRRQGNTHLIKQKKGVPGTVLSLKPSEPIVSKPNATVFEVSQLMTAKRENCILVVDEANNGQVLGIFTAKDLAFRIVGANLNANNVTIDKIMTPNPMCTHTSDPASDALNLMVEKGFRHLPVLNDNDQLVGVLDITKCYAQQMEKLERMHDSSKKLYEALDTVHSEMGLMQQPLQVYQYFETLKNKMNGPTLDSVLDNSTFANYCSMKTSVYEATVLMKDHKTTAVLVKDNYDKVNGIFTSKDVVLRVIAAGLDPKTCSIVRVMTPQPDVADQSLSIQEALRKMFDGHYLNLPVSNDAGDIIGIVDVLKLTYATLNQIKLINELELGSDSDSNVKSPEGPAWNKFWTSLDNDSDSVHSETTSARAETPVDSSAAPDFTDIKPSDSISAFETPKKLAINEDAPFIFKFRSSAIENRVHRVSLKPKEGLEKLRLLIDEKLHAKDFEMLRVTKAGEEGDSYAISYRDDEGDIVSITSDDDLIDCIKVNSQLNNDKADLYLHNPHEPAPIAASKTRKTKTHHNSDLIPGVPNEILFPGAILVLATSAVIGFSISRR